MPEPKQQRRIWSPLPTAIHDVGLPCIHLLGVMPQVIAVDRDAVGRLNFQPRFTATPQPVIAVRRGNTLILSVNLLGPLGMHHPSRGNKRPKITRRWYFDLEEAPADPQILLAVQRPAEAAAHA